MEDLGEEKMLLILNMKLQCLEMVGSLEVGVMNNIGEVWKEINGGVGEGIWMS